MAGDMNAATREVLFNRSFVVLIIAVIPWRYAWRRDCQDARRRVAVNAARSFPRRHQFPDAMPRRVSTAELIT